MQPAQQNGCPQENETCIDSTTRRSDSSSFFSLFVCFLLSPQEEFRGGRNTTPWRQSVMAYACGGASLIRCTAQLSLPLPFSSLFTSEWCVTRALHAILRSFNCANAWASQSPKSWTTTSRNRQSTSSGTCLLGSRNTVCATPSLVFFSPSNTSSTSAVFFNPTKRCTPERRFMACVCICMHL
jgi:hypothetical protein